MLILGVTNNDTAGACLVNDEKILAAVHEERFTRIKAHKIWPEKSVQYVLESSGKELKDIDTIAYGWNAGFNENFCLDLYVERIIYECINNFPNIGIMKKRITDELKNDKIKRGEFDNFVSENNLQSKVCYIDHHDTHAWGSWLCSGFEHALVVTCDGRGDFLSLTIRYIKEGNETVLQRETTIDSLGYFYGRITHLLNFKANRHEGKVTGLAAHGDPEKALPFMKEMINVINNRLVAHCGDLYMPYYQYYSDKLISRIKDYSPQDIAAAAQKHIENIMCELISPWLKQYHVKNVCLAGGIFGNVRLNQIIREMPGVDNVFVLPCMGDEGLPLAAAVTASWRKGGKRCLMKSMALGPSFKDKEIRDLLNKESGLEVSEPENILKEIIYLLQQNKIMAFFRNKMEFGPRALCNRSIVYHAHNKNVNVWLNKMLKRTEFMPFAPVTSENLAKECFFDWHEERNSAEFMTMTWRCKDILISECPAVVHVDNTARPQVIKEENDPFMYNLINAWNDLTGQPCLVNTSFNRHEEPIVHTPEEALSVLREGVIDAIIFNDKFVVRKVTP